MAKIDLNRGVTKRKHYTGGDVYMYKDVPGVYLNVYGEEVSEKLAKQCGFPVERLALERERRGKVAEEIAKINERYGVDQDKVVYEKGGFKVVGAGEGRYQVMSPEGHLMTEQPLTEKEAKKLVDTLASGEKEK